MLYLLRYILRTECSSLGNYTSFAILGIYIARECLEPLAFDKDYPFHSALFSGLPIFIHHFAYIIQNKLSTALPFTVYSINPKLCLNQQYGIVIGFFYCCERTSLLKQFYWYT